MVMISNGPDEQKTVRVHNNCHTALCLRRESWLPASWGSWSSFWEDTEADVLAQSSVSCLVWGDTTATGTLLPPLPREEKVRELHI